VSDILKKLASRLDEAIKYDPSCQYELDVKAILQSAGIDRTVLPANWQKNPNYCNGTSAGADAAFAAWDPKTQSIQTFNLECKNGAGMKGGSNSPTHPVAKNMMKEVEKWNTDAHLLSLVKADFRTHTGKKSKGLTITGDIHLVDDDALTKIATEIKKQHTANFVRLQSGEVKGVPLYYYFIRTDAATGLEGFDLVPFDLSDPDSSLVGNWTDNYNKSNTYYLQIGKGGGMYWMGSDPLCLGPRLGVKQFSGNVTTSGRYRWKASSSKPVIVSGQLTVGDPTTGATGEIDYKVIGRRPTFYAVEDMTLTKGASSGFDLDAPGSAQKLADAVKKPGQAFPAWPKECLGDKSESVLERLLFLKEKKVITKKLLKTLLMSEGITRGDIYEDALVKGVNTSGVADVRMAKNDATAWDLNAYIATAPGVWAGKGTGLQAKIEVKLGPEDQLGKIWKESFKKLAFDPGTQTWIGEMKTVGTSMSAGKGTDKTITQADVDLGTHLIEALNDSPQAAKEMMKIINNDDVTFPDKTGEVNLRETIKTQLKGKNPGEKGARGYGITGTVRDEEYRTKTQRLQWLKTQRKTKRNPEGKLSQEEYESEKKAIEDMEWKLVLTIPAEDVTHIFDAKVNYLIVGNGPGSEGIASGRIGVVGPDILGTGADDIDFSDSSIEIRWGNKGTKKKPSYSFTIETRAVDVAVRGGTPFKNGEELAQILTKNSAKVDRTKRRSEFGGKKLGLPTFAKRRANQQAESASSPTGKLLLKELLRGISKK